ncbi:MAG: family 43 glycosylhydrolase [Phycisphaerales bacterium]|nr:MAG: family 43 glycosylhydrolase [Phycisphaerales bacterium]
MRRETVSMLVLTLPFILPDSTSETYYLYKSSMTVTLKDGRSRQGVCVYVSKDLEMWKGPIPVFHFPDGFWADQSIWAPEVHKYKGKYHLFDLGDTGESLRIKKKLLLPTEQR